MKRMWKAVLALLVSYGVVTAASSGCSTDPAKFLPMMEKMHPGFIEGLVSNAGQ